MFKDRFKYFEFLSGGKQRNINNSSQTTRKKGESGLYPLMKKWGNCVCSQGSSYQDKDGLAKISSQGAL